MNKKAISRNAVETFFAEHPEMTKEKEVTKNQRGFMSLEVDPNVYDPWIKSLPFSGKPLLDLGAAYGVHTLKALEDKRHVIAVDREPKHLSVLRERIRDANVQGKLIRATCVTLPAHDVCFTGEVAGILIAEVVHFLKPGEPELLFKDAFRWLCEGGYLVLITGSSFPARNKPLDAVYGDSRIKTIGDCIDYAADDELIKSPPGFSLNEEGSLLRTLTGESLYLMSTRELEILARRTGFQVETLEYISTNKYPIGRCFAKNEVLLVAYKRNFNTAAV